MDTWIMLAQEYPSFRLPVSCFSVVSCNKNQTWQPSEIFFFFFNERWALTQYTDKLKAQLLLDTRAASEKALDGALLVRVLQQSRRAMVGEVFLSVLLSHFSRVRLCVTP